MASGLTPKLPLNIGEEGDFLLLKNYEDLVKQNLRILLMTNPGERPMDSYFGVGIRRYLFEQNLVTVYAEIEGVISEQVEKYMPFVSVEEISIEEIQDANAIKIQVFYYIEPLDIEDSLLLLIKDLQRL